MPQENTTGNLHPKYIFQRERDEKRILHQNNIFILPTQQRDNGYVVLSLRKAQRRKNQSTGFSTTNKRPHTGGIHNQTFIIRSIIMEPEYDLKTVQERLDFYYTRMGEYDEEEHEDYQVLDYIKERISFWKKERLKAEEAQFFKDMNRALGIE